MNLQTCIFYSECQSISKCKIWQATFHTNAPSSVINDQIINDSFKYDQDLVKGFVMSFFHDRNELKH